MLASRLGPVLAATLTATVAFAQSDEAHDGDDAEAPQASADGADDDWRRPLEVRNQIPLALLFASITPDRAMTLDGGVTALSLQFDYSNIITGQESDEELVVFDLEYLRTNFVVRHGFSRGIELGVSLPLYVYYGVFLDPFVSGFHEALGLPNFLRGQAPNRRVRFEYVREDSTPFLGDDGFGAVGDLSVHFKKTLLEKHPYALALRTTVKLPTGDPETLSGSGATDLGIGGAFDRTTERWGLYTNLNYHVLGQPERFTARNYLSFMVGADYRLKPRLTALLQFDHAQPFIEGDLPLFNDGAQQIALGLRWRQSDRFVYEWRFVEDLSDVAPDFTFGFQLGVRWDTKEAPSSDAPGEPVTRR